MNKYLVFILIFIIITFNSIFSQNTQSKSAFISIHSGLFSSAVQYFSKTYDSNSGFVYGIGIGLPVSSRSYIYSKATLFSKSGVPVIRSYIAPGIYTETKEGNAEFSQWIINAGFLYHFFLGKGFLLGLNGGGTFTSISEEIKNKEGNVTSSTKGSGALGYYIGGELEKNFKNNAFAVFTEIQYNSCRNDLLILVTNYGGINYNFGVRYYFRSKRVE